VCGFLSSPLIVLSKRLKLTRNVLVGHCLGRPKYGPCRVQVFFAQHFASTERHNVLELQPITERQIGPLHRRSSVPYICMRRGYLGLRSTTLLFTMPGHDFREPGRSPCSDRRSNRDRNRRVASRFLADSSLRLAHSTAHKKTAGGVSCHSLKQIPCGASQSEAEHGIAQRYVDDRCRAPSRDLEW